jgi:hypothetical protein
MTTAPPDRRPYRRMSATGPEQTFTTSDHSYVFRQLGWLGQSGAFYSLDEKPSEHERGGWAPLYLLAHADRTDEATHTGQLDTAYRERARLLALLATMTPGAVLAPAPDVTEPGWQILFLTIGGQQCSWHIAPADASLFDHVEYVPATDPRAQWDGHTTDEKYERIAEHAAELALRCGPECAEGHTEAGRCEIARNR